MSADKKNYIDIPSVDDRVKDVIKEGRRQIEGLKLIKQVNALKSVAFIGDQNFNLLKSYPSDLKISFVDPSSLSFAIVVPYGSRVSEEDTKTIMLWKTEMVPERDDHGVIHTPVFQWHYHSDADERCRPTQGAIYGYMTMNPQDRSSWKEYYTVVGEEVVFPAGMWHTVNCVRDDKTKMDVWFKLVN
jgi:hypothetical protein